MQTTEHMGLVIWELPKDEFDHSILADNFVTIDQHKHGGSVKHGKYVNGDTEEVESLTPEPKREITNYAEGNSAEAKWEATGSGEAIQTPEFQTGGAATAIKPETIWRYLLARRAVGHNQIDKEGVWRENIKKEAVGEEQLGEEAVSGKKLKKGVLPLGIIVAWYKSPNEPNPGDWKICNGEPIGTNDLGLPTNTPTPNLVNKFIRGCTPGESNLGTEGGAEGKNFSHTHSLPNHTHTVNNHTHTTPGHRHGIELAGFHNHTYAGGFQMRTRQNAFTNEVTLTIHDSKGFARNNWYESLYVAAPFFDHDGEKIEPPFDEVVAMDESGSHTHGGGFTQEGGGGLSTGGATPQTGGTEPFPQNTGSALGFLNTEPPWYGLCYIMKVKKE